MLKVNESTPLEDVQEYYVELRRNAENLQVSQLVSDYKAAFDVILEYRTRPKL